MSGIALAIVVGLNIGVKVDGIGSLAMATIVIGLLNSLVRPVLVLLTLPLNCMTFGLFGIILNALLFASAHIFVPGFQTDAWGAIIGSVMMGVISSVLSNILPDKKK
jgi:putative membrane protein